MERWEWLYSCLNTVVHFFLSEHMHYLTKDTVLKANNIFILDTDGTTSDLGAAFCRKKLWLTEPIFESER